jgi:hypothetical protein
VPSEATASHPELLPLAVISTTGVTAAAGVGELVVRAVGARIVIGVDAVILEGLAAGARLGDGREMLVALGQGAGSNWSVSSRWPRRSVIKPNKRVTSIVMANMAQRTGWLGPWFAGLWPPGRDCMEVP